MEIKESRFGYDWQSPVDGYQYKTEKGDAQIIIQDVSFRVGTKAYDILINYGLSPEDKMAHLNEFYPNGRGLNEESGENMRTGFGTKVLEYLINKSISKGAKAMFVFSGKKSMQAFLLKHGFIEVGKYQYIKKL